MIHLIQTMHSRDGFDSYYGAVYSENLFADRLLKEDQNLKIKSAYAGNKGLDLGALTIRFVGMPPTIESIEFEGGELVRHRTVTIDNHQIEFCDRKSNIKETRPTWLQIFANEFNEIFKIDIDLNSYLGTHFSDLYPYLK